MIDNLIVKIWSDKRLVEEVCHDNWGIYFGIEGIVGDRTDFKVNLTTIFKQGVKETEVELALVEMATLHGIEPSNKTDHIVQPMD